MRQTDIGGGEDERTHHLFKNTNNTVLAIFKQIHSVSTICLCRALGCVWPGGGSAAVALKGCSSLLRFFAISTSVSRDLSAAIAAGERGRESWEGFGSMRTVARRYLENGRKGR